MSLNHLELLGRLARARESVRIAQRELDAAIQMACSGGSIHRTNLDMSACVATALVNADQAVADLEALGQIFKPL